MTEEEEYRNAGITKEECRKTPEEELEILAIKVRNGEIPPDDVLEHFKNDVFLKYFKNKYRKEIYGMSPDFFRKIGYKKCTKN